MYEGRTYVDGVPQTTFSDILTLEPCNKMQDLCQSYPTKSSYLHSVSIFLFSQKSIVL